MDTSFEKGKESASFGNKITSNTRCKKELACRIKQENARTSKKRKLLHSRTKTTREEKLLEDPKTLLFSVYTKVKLGYPKQLKKKVRRVNTWPSNITGCTLNNLF